MQQRVQMMTTDKIDLSLEKAKLIVGKLEAIIGLGGNLSDDVLTDRTGPNDAAHRGIMYTTARAIAKEALNDLKASIDEAG